MGCEIPCLGSSIPTTCQMEEAGKTTVASRPSPHWLADSQVDVMFHETHAGISRPALLVIVAHNVLVVWVRVLCEVALDQVPGLISRESEVEREKSVFHQNSGKNA